MRCRDEAFSKAIAVAIKRWTATPFTWGVDDCLMALADIYVEVLGVDPAADYRGRYKTRIGAYRKLGRGGVGGVLAQVAGQMAWPAVIVSEAPIGALGRIETLDGPAGVIFGGVFWVGRTEFGFSAHRRGYVTQAWRVVGAMVEEGSPCR